MFWTSGDICLGLLGQNTSSQLYALLPVHNGFFRFASWWPVWQPNLIYPFSFSSSGGTRTCVIVRSNQRSY